MCSTVKRKWPISHIKQLFPSLFREAGYNFHSPFFLRGNWPDNWPIPIKHRGVERRVGVARERKSEERRRGCLRLPSWTKLLHLWQLFYSNKISGVSRANKSSLISILYMNLTTSQFTKTSTRGSRHVQGRPWKRWWWWWRGMGTVVTILQGWQGSSPAQTGHAGGGGGHRLPS